MNPCTYQLRSILLISQKDMDLIQTYLCPPSIWPYHPLSILDCSSCQLLQTASVADDLNADSTIPWDGLEEPVLTCFINRRRPSVISEALEDVCTKTKVS